MRAKKQNQKLESDARFLRSHRVEPCYAALDKLSKTGKDKKGQKDE